MDAPFGPIHPPSPQRKIETAPGPSTCSIGESDLPYRGNPANKLRADTRIRGYHDNGVSCCHAGGSQEESDSMPYTIAMVAQKGGVGKSTLARMIAVEAAKGGLRTKIGDLDAQQSTCVQWAVRRARGGYKPLIRAEPFASVDVALKDADGYDLYVFDGAPHSSVQDAAGVLGVRLGGGPDE